MKSNFIILSITVVILLCLVFYVAVQRDVVALLRDEYKKSLIEFKHARYIIDPVTGKSDFQVDNPPQ